MRATTQQVIFGVTILVFLAAGGFFVARKVSLRDGKVQLFSPAVKKEGQASAKTGIKVLETNAPSALVAAATRPGTNSSAAVRGGKDNKPEALTADQQAAEKMRELLEKDDEKGAIELARQLATSSDAEVRSQVATTLGWIGVKALPELSQMLADVDDTVAQDAFNQWENAVDEVQDDALKSQLLQAGMQTMKNQSDLEACVMKFYTMPYDIAVRGLVNIIGSGNVPAAEAARDGYSFVTGTDYVSPAAAEASILKHAEEDATPKATK